MPDINDLKDSADKLAKQARETAELSVQVAREQLHKMVKDPDMVRKIEEAEAVFDRQVQEVSKRIEDGAHQFFSLFNNLMTQAPGGQTATSEGPTVTKIEVEPSESTAGGDKPKD